MSKEINVGKKIGNYLSKVIVSPLFIVFLVLKLCGTINWSWWWVTAPLWGPFVFLAALLLVCTIIVGICSLIEKE